MKLLLIETQERSFHKVMEEHREKIRQVKSDLEIVVVDANEQQEIERQLDNTDVVAGALWAIPALSNIKNLKWIHSASAGVDRVLTAQIKASDILVSNSSGIHAVSIAEHILGFMLIFTRRFYQTFRNQQRKVWKKQGDITELRGKVALIVGLGHIGLETARLASCVGARVIAVDQPGKVRPDFVEELYSTSHLNGALPKGDFVVLCLPYTQETHHSFDMEKFQMMNRNAVLINIGRGGVVYEKDLIEALQTGIIGGAALDVTETEPLPKDSPLWEMENVIITPHHSGWSEKYMDRAIDLFCVNLKAYLQGERLPNLVDKERGY